MKDQLYSTQLCFSSECFAARGKGMRVLYELPNLIVGVITKVFMVLGRMRTALFQNPDVKGIVVMTE
ncbi:unnamed protein product [Urochloa humidicola]